MEEEMKLAQSLIGDQLMQGKELAKKLSDYLASPSSSSPSSLSSNDETKEELIEKILSTYEQALTMLNWKADNVMDSHCCSLANVNPKSEVLDQEVLKKKDVFKKRKTMPRWTKQVKVSPGTAIDSSLEDGYSWRKYGQKDILGAKFPRGYYRCTHRNVQGCLATKQVQKSDEDPTIFEITYRGRHTCFQASNYHSNKALFQSKPNMALGENKNQKNQPQETEKTEQPPPPQELTMIKFASSEPEVRIEDLDTKENIFSSFCFSPPSIKSENEDNHNNIFSETMIENHFLEAFPPTFMSPTTPETNMFCISPCQLGSNGIGPSVQASDSDITELLSAPTSVTNSPITDLDFLLDFETDFPTNSLELFSS